MPPETPTDSATTLTGASPAPASPPARLETIPTSTQVVRDEGAIDQSDWKRKYDSVRGVIDAKQAQWDQWQGQQTTVMQQLRDQIADLQSQLQSVQGERDEFKKSVDRIPELEEQATLATAMTQQNQKLQEILRYPNVLAQTVVETKEEEGQEPVTVRKNAYLDLALSSSLEGTAFTEMLAQVEASLPTFSNAAPPAARPLNMTPPPQPAPVQTSRMAELMEAYAEASNTGNRAEAQRINEEILKLKHSKPS